MRCHLHESVHQKGYTLIFRQLFYQLVSTNKIANTDKQYDRLGDWLLRHGTRGCSIGNIYKIAFGYFKDKEVRVGPMPEYRLTYAAKTTRILLSYAIIRPRGLDNSRTP